MTVAGLETVGDGSAARDGVKRVHELDGIADRVAVGIYRTDVDWRVAYLNRYAAQLLGFDEPEDVVGRKLAWDPYAPDTSREEVCARLDATRSLLRHEVRWARRDGSMVWVRESARAVRDASGRVKFYEGTLEDIQELMAAREQRRRDAERAHANARVAEAFARRELSVDEALASVANEIARTLGDLCVIRLLSGDRATLEPRAVSHADAEKKDLAEELLAHARQPASQGLSGRALNSGRSWMVAEFDSETAKVASESAYREYFERVGIHSLIIANIRVGEEVEGQIAITRDVAGKPYTDDDKRLLEDLADRAGFVLERTKLVESLRQELHKRNVFASKLSSMNQELERRVAARTRELREMNEELSRFSYTLSHDLRAPLRVIGGFARLLLEREDLPMDQDSRELLEGIERNALQMNDMVVGILELSRLRGKTLDRRRLDLSAMVHEILDEYARTDAGRVVERVVEPGVHVDADPVLVRSLMQNLLSNAWKFTREKPFARIRFGTIPTVSPTTFFVADNGRGFDPEEVSQLFVPFQRLHEDEATAGTGVGLVTVERVARRHGGRAWAQGRRGEGATVYFTLGPDAGAAS